MRSFLAYCCIISTLYAVRMGKRKFSQIADSQSKALDASYFEHHDVVELARSLIGKILHTQIDGKYTSGYITETEAYCGATDKACHAHLGKTGRNQIMFDAGGAVYVYRCYGLHNLFNIVTNTVDNADAILVRAIEPIEGAEHMLARRNITMDISKPKPKLCCGPGNMSKALGINTTHYGLVMPCDAVWVSEGRTHGREEVVETVRVGIDYAEEDALLPWRFYPKDCKWISKK